MTKLFPIVVIKTFCDYSGYGSLSYRQTKVAATLEDAKSIAKQMWEEERKRISETCTANERDPIVSIDEYCMVYRDASCELKVEIETLDFWYNTSTRSIE